MVSRKSRRVVKAAARNKNATEMQQQHKGAWLRLKKQQQRVQRKATTEGSGGERDFCQSHAHAESRVTSCRKGVHLDESKRTISS
jgi:hypothetical protein